MTTIDDGGIPRQGGIKSVERHPCGCFITTLEGGSVDIKPCLPCALQAAGDWLRKAADAMREEVPSGLVPIDRTEKTQ